MSTILRADDFKKNLLITIYTSKALPLDDAFEDENPCGEIRGMFGSMFKYTTVSSFMMGTSENDTLQGEVLRIRAICLPYILVNVLSGKRKGKMLKFDSRDISFMKINRSYAQVLIDKKEK